MNVLQIALTFERLYIKANKNSLQKLHARAHAFMHDAVYDLS